MPQLKTIKRIPTWIAVGSIISTLILIVTMGDMYVTRPRITFIALDIQKQIDNFRNGDISRR